jgi:uncharacterized membrane protein YbhN (UPF0104 family)
MLVTFTSYAFNLNLGSLVGGVAFRFRLYSRLGLKPGAITRIMSISMLANWMGYVLLAGLVFSLHPPTLPLDWPVTTLHLRLAGLALLRPPWPTWASAPSRASATTSCAATPSNCRRRGWRCCSC